MYYPCCTVNIVSLYSPVISLYSHVISLYSDVISILYNPVLSLWSCRIHLVRSYLYNLVHTMDELKLTGNCLKGSRPILSFDKVSVT